MFSINDNYTYASSDVVLKTNEVYTNVTDKKIIDRYRYKREDHILHKDNFDYHNLEDISRLRKTPVPLRALLKNFSIEEPHVPRFSMMPLVNTHTNEEQRSRLKLHTLSHTHNDGNHSVAHHNVRVSKNNNLHHRKTYASQSHGGKTSFNNNNFERVGNSLIYKGQNLKGTLEQRLHSSNGGNYRGKDGRNFLITTDSSHPLTGKLRKLHHHEVSKHHTHVSTNFNVI